MDDTATNKSEMNGSSSTNNNNGNDSNASHPVILEQERFMPIANISRIMKRVLPEHAKLSKEAKECIQECITEFFLFITSEAAEKCNIEKRKTITGEDLLVSMETLGFDNYLLPLRAFLRKYKEATKSERPASEADDSNENHHHQTYASPPSLQHQQPSTHLMENYPQQQSQQQNQTYIIQEAAETINHYNQQRLQQQQAANSNHHQQVQQQQQQPDDVDDIINYLPPNFRRVTEIYVDTTTEQHYISATSPGGTTGLIPIQLQATSVDGPPQPISVSTFSQQQQQNRQQNGL